jgi:hypothetical protein
MIIRAIHNRVSFIGAALVVGVIGAVALMVFFSALHGVYVASLYRFATGGGATSGLDPTLLGQTFMPKTR